MASQTNDKKAVFGYVRKEFSNDCWVNEIIQIIIQYYLNKGGSLYVFGDGAHGKLGIEEYYFSTCESLTICPPFDNLNALDVSAGNNHTLMLDIDGQVWSCGTGCYGQLGNDQNDDIDAPDKLNLMQPAIAVAAGGHHSLILLQNGNVQSFGQGQYGQLGQGNENNLCEPKTIEALQHVKIMQIAVGDSHSACLSDNGELFCFGDNTEGECGVGQDKGRYIFTPTKIKFEDKVIMVQCGAQHILFVACEDLVYSFGCGEHGCLGHGDEENKYTPKLIDAFKHVKLQSFAAGSCHTICVDVAGIVWSFGSNSDGDCGLGTEIEDQLTPKVNEYFVKNNIKAVDCAAGGFQSCILSDDGDLYVFGCNDLHQLGLKTAQKYFTPTNLPLPQDTLANLTVEKVSFGFEHTAMICSGK